MPSVTRTKSPWRKLCAMARNAAAAVSQPTMSLTPPVDTPNSRRIDCPIIRTKIVQTAAAASQAAAL
jgi:hypothetical protein